MIKIILNLCFVLILLTMTASCAVPSAGTTEQAPAVPATIASESIADVIAKYREVIPQEMQARRIPGLAIAIVDDQGILWSEGFGYTDWDRQTPITPATIFSIQSMSKSFAATAAMIAAQEGLVDLDAPITTYLPDFTVQSIFEEHPEQQMTMRILLSHTAGFPHDPLYGGNYDGPFGAPSYSFEKHIASVSDTWLMFPVGSHYSYSNIGIDLAGYILQVRSGMPFIQYVQKKVLDPLGMKDSTLDYQQVRANTTRAIGHMEAPIRPPVDFQLIPSGGVWSSAEDMARYLQFHINKGSLDPDAEYPLRLLREDLAETMYMPPNLPAIEAYGYTSYALGVTVDNRNNTRHFQHGGGGFGFNSSMVWYPDLKLGSVVLTNFPQSDGYCVQLSEDVLESIMMSDISLYHERSISAVKVPPAYPYSRNLPVLSDAELKALIASKALFVDAAQEDGAAKQRRNTAVGTYIATAWGLPVDSIEIGETDGKLTWNYHGEMMISESTTLTEVQPGLYFSTSGNLVDLRGPARMIDNVRLMKANPQEFAFRAVFYALCTLVFLSTLFFFPVWGKARRSQRKTAPADMNHTVFPSNHLLVGSGILAGFTSLFSLFCLAMIAIVPNLIYIPWPLPFIDLAWWQFALVGLPFANLILSAGVTLLAALTAWKFTGARLARWYYLAVGIVLLAFNAAILI